MIVQRKGCEQIVSLLTRRPLLFSRAPSQHARALRTGVNSRRPRNLNTPSTVGLLKFNPTFAAARLDTMWGLTADFGMEELPNVVYMEEIISDRFCLTRGAQMMRDELMLAFNHPKYKQEDASVNLSDVQECAADLSIPTVLSTCAFTVCGDRICQSRAQRQYLDSVAGRFSSISEYGTAKPELFFATGGGTDDGATLAHVTVVHAVDRMIKERLYNGNESSFVLVNIDVSTHCGHLDVGHGHEVTMAGKTYKDVGVVYGMAQESIFRDPRAACGAVVGMLSNFNENNQVHVRLRKDLGEENFKFLRENEIVADDGSPVNFLVAAVIIAVRGMRSALHALATELDERGLGHCTAMVQVNHGDTAESILYCARGTVFNGEVREQGLGTAADKFSARMLVGKGGQKRVQLSYGGHGPEESEQTIRSSRYEVQVCKNEEVEE